MADRVERRRGSPSTVTTLRRCTHPAPELPLRPRGQASHAVNLFHRQPGPLPAPDLASTQALADVATIGIHPNGPSTALKSSPGSCRPRPNSRVIIEQAIGVLTHQVRISSDAAFDQLRRHARRHRHRLAQQVSPGCW